MIAKLPGDKRLFMGDNLEMVCLFQAAEIERLIDNLDEYKLKYKEVERKELDRHSYEVQIKELAQQVLEADGSKSENQKLKDFIRKQAAELEDWKKRMSDVDVNLQRKYENALRQIDSLLQDNIGIKSENNAFKSEVGHLRAKLEAIERSKAKELDELREQFDSQKRSQVERELRELHNRFQGERSQLELDIRRLRESLESRARENEDLKGKIGSLTLKIQELTARSENKTELEAKVRDYEGKIVQVTRELERLNRVLADKSNEANELAARLRAAESDSGRFTVEIREVSRRLTSSSEEVERLARDKQGLERRLQELGAQNSKIAEYEARIAQAEQEIQRLNYTLKGKVAENQDLQSRAGKLEFDFENYKREAGGKLADIERLGNSTRELQLTLAKITSENKFLSDENVRAQESLRLSTSNIQKLTQELNDFRGRIGDMKG